MAIISQPPLEVYTAIIGGGPASLILSYILHGYIPYYKGGHRDQLLDAKLRTLPNLLYITPEIWSHFGGDLRYASQALPVNALLDTLVRPDADTEINPETCIDWRHEPSRSVSHIVLGSANAAGGQWTQTEGDGIDRTSTLSYAELLSLPGYTFADFYLKHNGTPMPELERPSRESVAQYYAEYPLATGISDSLFMNHSVTSVTRERDGFRLQPVNIFCQKLVLGTGIFDHLIPPPKEISILTECHSSELPLLIVGSGYSAADAIISSTPQRRIIHVYKWDPINSPSPLKGCHRQAYPEYASVYRQMKGATKTFGQSSLSISSLMDKKKSKTNGWERPYSGLPNASVEGVKLQGNRGIARIRHEDGTVMDYLIGDFKYLVGRRGSLSYLEPSLRKEIFADQSSIKLSIKDASNISGRTLRSKAEVDTEIAPAVFIIGSLTGDSLVRHAFGSSVHAAGRILGKP